MKDSINNINDDKLLNLVIKPLNINDPIIFNNLLNSLTIAINHINDNYNSYSNDIKSLFVLLIFKLYYNNSYDYNIISLIDNFNDYYNLHVDDELFYYSNDNDNYYLLKYHLDNFIKTLNA